MLKDLKIYLRLTEYMWSYVFLYFLIIQPLQELKTQALKKSLDKDKLRKAFTIKTLITSFKNEIRSFKVIQDYFSQEIMLVHFNLKRCFYIDLDTSDREFSVVIYHIKKELNLHNEIVK